MSLLDDLNAGGGWRMPGATKWRRLRARKVDDPYSGEQAGEDWSNPETLDFAGALASSSSTRTPDGLREATWDEALDLVAGKLRDTWKADKSRLALPDDGRRWEVSGYPSRDANAFTSWQPTVEIPLSEYRG